MCLTLHDLRTLAGPRKLPMLTCYDATFARLFDDAGVDLLLIGDSLGMAEQGHDSTLPVTVDDIAYHTRAVLRGAARAWVVADVPFGSYQAAPEQACGNAVRLMQAGAQMVKPMSSIRQPRAAPSRRAPDFAVARGCTWSG